MTTKSTILFICWLLFAVIIPSLWVCPNVLSLFQLTHYNNAIIKIYVAVLCLCCVFSFLYSYRKLTKNKQLKHYVLCLIICFSICLVSINYSFIYSTTITVCIHVFLCQLCLAVSFGYTMTVNTEMFQVLESNTETEMLESNTQTEMLESNLDQKIEYLESKFVCKSFEYHVPLTNKHLVKIDNLYKQFVNNVNQEKKDKEIQDEKADCTDNIKSIAVNATYNISDRLDADVKKVYFSQKNLVPSERTSLEERMKKLAVFLMFHERLPDYLTDNKCRSYVIPQNLLQIISIPLVILQKNDALAFSVAQTMYKKTVLLCDDWIKNEDPKAQQKTSLFVGHLVWTKLIYIWNELLQHKKFETFEEVINNAMSKCLKSEDFKKFASDELIV